MNELRELRRAIGLGQRAFAALLSTPLETYRPWDSGRRVVSAAVLQRARAAAVHHQRQHELLPLDQLARELHVHLRTLQLLAFRNDVFPYLHDTQFATLTIFDHDEHRALGPVPPRTAGLTSQEVIVAARDLMARVQDQLRAGIDALLQTGTWQPFGSEGPAPHWSLERRPDGTIGRSYMGAWNTITLASASDLLARWWLELRRCEHEHCRAWFLPAHGRQKYHRPRCSAEARYLRFKPKRNYKDEYARRHDSTRTRSRRRPSGRRT